MRILAAIMDSERTLLGWRASDGKIMAAPAASQNPTCWHKKIGAIWRPTKSYARPTSEGARENIYRTWGEPAGDRWHLQFHPRDSHAILMMEVRQ